MTLPKNFRKSVNGDRQCITIEMIHAGTIATEGEGLWIPKSTQGRHSKTIGRWLISFTGAITSRSDLISKGLSKRKHSDSDSDLG